MRFLAPPHQWFLKLAFLKTELWVYVTRAAAELPSFHGVGRKKLLAWPATQVQSGGGIVDTGNPTGSRWR
jgi:hypothetical protein